MPVRTPHRPNVLQVGPLKPSLRRHPARSPTRALVLPEPTRPSAPRSWPSTPRPITAAVTSGRTGVDAALIAALPQLGAIVHFGVGYDTTDVDAAAARGIAVSNTPDVLTDCVADTAVGLMIDTLRQFSAADRYVRAGRWPADGQLPADPPGERQPGRHRRPRAHRRCDRHPAQRVRMHDLLPQPAPGRRLPVHLRGLAGRARREPSTCWSSPPPAEAAPGIWWTPTSSRRSGRTGI